MKSFMYMAMIASLVLAPRALRAQNEAMSMLVYGTYSQPVGSYGKAIGEDPTITRRFGVDIGPAVGLAQSGWGVGLELRSNVLMQHFYWILSGRAISNATDASTVASHLQQTVGDTTSIQLHIGRWVNIPIFTGFSYAVGVGEETRLYAIVQGGLNLTRQASRTFAADGVVVEETRFNMTPDFGFEAGVGVELWNGLDISVRYMDLSAPRYDGTRKLNEAYFSQIARRETYIQGDERKISMVNVMIGYTLW